MVATKYFHQNIGGNGKINVKHIISYKHGLDRNNYMANYINFTHTNLLIAVNTNPNYS